MNADEHESGEDEKTPDSFALEAADPGEANFIGKLLRLNGFPRPWLVGPTSVCFETWEDRRAAILLLRSVGFFRYEWNALLPEDQREPSDGRQEPRG